MIIGIICGLLIIYVAWREYTRDKREEQLINALAGKKVLMGKTVVDREIRIDPILKDKK